MYVFSDKIHFRFWACGWSFDSDFVEKSVKDSNRGAEL